MSWLSQWYDYGEPMARIFPEKMYVDITSLHNRAMSTSEILSKVIQFPGLPWIADSIIKVNIGCTQYTLGE